jgi:hypothetical protein
MPDPAPERSGLPTPADAACAARNAGVCSWPGWSILVTRPPPHPALKPSHGATAEHGDHGGKSKSLNRQAALRVEARTPAFTRYPLRVTRHGYGGIFPLVAFVALSAVAFFGSWHFTWRVCMALTISSLTSCHWTTPQVENAFSNLRVDVIKSDAPNYTFLVHNNSPDHLQVIIRSTASKSWSPDKSHEERFVLDPQGGNSFPVPINTKQVQVVVARPIRY